MASKKKTHSKKKEQHQADYYPVQRTTGIGVNGGNFASGSIYTACADQLMSQVNRRMYRHGNLYQVKIDLDLDVGNATSFEVDVYALANNWDTQRAFALAKAEYEKAMAAERAVSPQQVARWEDFRTITGITGATIVHPNLYLRDTLASTVVPDGEFNGSVVDNAGTTTSFSWGQAGSGTFSIIGEWDNAGKVLQTPESGENNAPYDGLNADDLSNVEKQALRERGDLPPYNQDNNPEVWVRVGKLFVRHDGPAGSMARLSTGYFDAPCGFVVLQPTVVGGGNLTNGTLRLTCKAGDYKGIAAKAMSQTIRE